MYKPAVSLLSCLWLSACAVGPDYQAPELPEQATAAFASTGSTTSAEALPADWWHLYDDPVLDQLVQTALEANTDLRVATANLEQAQAVLRENNDLQWPSSQVSASQRYGDNVSGAGGTATIDEQWVTSAGIDVAWEADLTGRVRRTLEASRASVEAVAAARDGVRAMVVAETARQYVTACTLAESITAAQDSIGIARQTLDLLVQQEQVGNASGLDVERAVIILANTEAALPLLQSRRQNALFALTTLLGSTPAQVPVEATQCSQAPGLSAPLPVADGAGLLRRRPDLRQAERQLAADTARIGIATADLYPSISLNASVNYFNLEDTGSNATTYNLGPLLSWHFPNVNAARARIMQAEAKAQASLASFDGSVLNALREVEQALTTLNAEEQRHQALVRADSSAGNAYSIAEQRYQAGSISRMDLLDISRERVAARYTLTESELALHTARINLFKALGGGW